VLRRNLLINSSTGLAVAVLWNLNTETQMQELNYRDEQKIGPKCRSLHFLEIQGTYANLELVFSAVLALFIPFIDDRRIGV
jgi:hypothetical protein